MAQNKSEEPTYFIVNDQLKLFISSNAYHLIKFLKRWKHHKLRIINTYGTQYDEIIDQNYKEAQYAGH